MDDLVAGRRGDMDAGTEKWDQQEFGDLVLGRLPAAR